MAFQAKPGGWGGIRTPGAFRHTRFPGVHNQPLCHPSVVIFLFLCILILVRLETIGTEEEGEEDYYSCKRRNNSSSGNWMPM